MRYLAVTAMLLVGGCATASSDAKIYPGLFGQQIDGNSSYVTVSNVYNEMDARPLADGHCGGFDKVARFSRMEGRRAIFDCVSR